MTSRVSPSEERGLEACQLGPQGLGAVPQPASWWPTRLCWPGRPPATAHSQPPGVPCFHRSPLLSVGHLPNFFGPSKVAQGKYLLGGFLPLPSQQTQTGRAQAGWEEGGDLGRHGHAAGGPDSSSHSPCPPLGVGIGAIEHERAGPVDEGHWSLWALRTCRYSLSSSAPKRMGAAGWAT